MTTPDNKHQIISSSTTTTTSNATASTSSSLHSIQDLLFHPHVSVKSFSHWKPSQSSGRLQLTTDMMGGNPTEGNDNIISTSWVTHNREDRKQGLVIPKCPTATDNNATTRTSRMRMRGLLIHGEEDLAWVGLHFTGQTPQSSNKMDTMIIANITVILNNNPVKLKYKPTLGGTTQYIGWVRVVPPVLTVAHQNDIDNNIPPISTTTRTTIALCHVGPATTTVAMDYVVAVLTKEK